MLDSKRTRTNKTPARSLLKSYFSGAHTVPASGFWVWGLVFGGLGFGV
jgi:hypothetical protein